MEVLAVAIPLQALVEALVKTSLRQGFADAETTARRMLLTLMVV